MKEYEIALCYSNGETQNHFICDTCMKHWQSDAPSVSRFIDELVDEADNCDSIAYDVRECFDKPFITEVWAYDVDESPNGFEFWRTDHAIRLTKEMFEEEL